MATIEDHFEAIATMTAFPGLPLEEWEAIQAEVITFGQAVVRAVEVLYYDDPMAWAATRRPDILLMPVKARIDALAGAQPKEA